MPRVIVYIAGLGAICLLAGGFTRNLVTAQGTPDETSPEVTVRPPVSTTAVPHDTILPLCPPKPPVKEDGGHKKNLLIVSTLDGQLSALDLDKDGEMFWSVSTYPGSMLTSSISHMELDNRGQYVKLIPSLTGRLYKFNREMVEPIPIDVDTLLGSSLRMQENMVVSGGKESRTYGILKDTGEILYECSMNDCTNFQENNTKDILVVQRNSQTVRAHTPRSGEQKWNFSVSLHELAYHPSEDPCQEEEEEVVEVKDDFTIKTVVPEGIICATTEADDNLIKWKRKFLTPIVDVWKLKNGKLVKVNLFSKNHIPKRSVLLDDDDDISDDENPSLYVGKHNNQLYIQESVNLRREGDSVLNDYSLNPASTDLMYPRVSWKPYLVSPSRTPVFNHGSLQPDAEVQLLSFDQTTMKLGDSKTTALAITSQNADYPYDAGFYLYPDTTPLDASDVIANITALKNPRDNDQESEGPDTTVEFIYMGLWYWWKEVIFISLVTAVMMNVLITRPIIHRMRDGFQEASRTLVRQVQEIQHEQATKEVVREVFVEVPVPSYSTLPATPSTATSGSSGPDFSTYDRQGSSEFSSRYLSDFEPVQCLGRGGFGVVFESKNKYDDIHYAVKRITLPSSEENKKKVMREVKLHAKLDHRNIVRYYSTWLETPPLGWQEAADAWFDEAELGTGPTPFDPTSTDYSLPSDNKRKNIKNIHNPLKFNGFSTGSFSKDYRARNGDGKNDISLNKNCDSNSCSIRFEDTGGITRSDNEDSDDEGESESEVEFVNEESTGGIMFLPDTHETKGSVEGVCVDIEASSSGPAIQFRSNPEDSTDSLSCCEALDWQENQNKGAGDLEARAAKTYLYIVMQLCKKETLRDWLRNNRVREETQVLSIFYQICVGVEYVHRQGLIHRDLKPSNIYIAHDGTIKIGDFGLLTGDGQGPAGDSNTNTSISDDQLTDAVGTQLYMSPEQLAQKPYNHKVDIFSLGLIFLELCVPFATQMERLRELSNVKKGKYPAQLDGKPEYTSLLGLMLNVRPEVRPEILEILHLPWLQGVQYQDTPRRRLKTLTDSSLDLSSEELLDVSQS